MNLELLTFNGYGLFIWPAFIFTFASCLILFVKTKKQLIKQEERFLKEYKYTYKEKIKSPKKKEVIEEALSKSPI